MGPCEFFCTCRQLPAPWQRPTLTSGFSLFPSAWRAFLGTWSMPRRTQVQLGSEWRVIASRDKLQPVGEGSVGKCSTGHFPPGISGDPRGQPRSILISRESHRLFSLPCSLSSLLPLCFLGSPSKKLSSCKSLSQYLLLGATELWH